MAELDLLNIARPYASAVFQIALEEEQLQAWADFLDGMALIAQNDVAHRALTDPRLTRQEKGKWLIALAEEKKLSSKSRASFLTMLADNHRLAILTVLNEAFHAHKREHERTVLIEVKSAVPLSEDQQSQLKAVLKKRYQREITLQMDVDSRLIGGVIVNAGDEIIDGSLRGQLQRLHNQLANPYQ